MAKEKNKNTKNETLQTELSEKLFKRLNMLQEQCKALKTEREEITHIKTLPNEQKKRVQKIEIEMQKNEVKVKELYENLMREQEQISRNSPPEILIIHGKNRSGKTRFMHLLQDWVGDDSSYFSETDKLPDDSNDDWLFIDNPLDENAAKQIEKLAMGRKVVLALTDINKFKFSPKAHVNILRIDGLDTIEADASSKN